jgi:Glycosyl transferase family 2
MPQQPETRISIIIPCFNGQTTLAETLDSVIAQTHALWDCIIVDDGSTDKTPQIAQHYADQDSRIQWITKANGGVASARNLGLQQAAADYVTFLDADDIWHPDYLSQHLGTLVSASPDTALSYCHLRHIDAHSNVITTMPAFALSGNIASCLAYFNFVCNPSCVVYRKSAVLSVGGYDERLRAQGVEGAEDYLLHLQVASHWPTIAVPAFLVGYRQTAASMSADLRRMMASCEQAILFFRQAQPSYPLPPQLERWRTGAFALRRAQMAMTARQWRGMVTYLATAFRFDPLRNLLAIAVTLHAEILSIWRGFFAMNQKAVPFCKMCPSDPPDALSLPRSLLHRLLTQRLQFAARYKHGHSGLTTADSETTIMAEKTTR